MADIVTIDDIAERLDVSRTALLRRYQRDRLPEPLRLVGRSPIWEWPDVVIGLASTGDMPPATGPTSGDPGSYLIGACRLVSWLIDHPLDAFTAAELAATTHLSESRIRDLLASAKNLDLVTSTNHRPARYQATRPDWLTDWLTDVIAQQP